MGRVGLEPKSVMPLTCDDAKTTNKATRFHPAGSRSIQLQREPCGVRRTASAAKQTRMAALKRSTSHLGRRAKNPLTPSVRKAQPGMSPPASKGQTVNPSYRNQIEFRRLEPRVRRGCPEPQPPDVHDQGEASPPNYHLSSCAFACRRGRHRDHPRHHRSGRTLSSPDPHGIAAGSGVPVPAGAYRQPRIVRLSGPCGQGSRVPVVTGRAMPAAMPRASESAAAR